MKLLRSLLPVLLLAAAFPAQAALKVVATTEGLASLAREVGGARVQVTALSKGIQDPHFVDARPSLVVSLRDATLLVDIGADLEIGWLPPLVTQARNAAILPGGAGRLSAASAVHLLDLPTGPVDRSQGDLHPGGNPHFLSDPHRGLAVARAIADRLKQLDAPGAAEYDAAYAAFEKKVQEAQKKWEPLLALLRGKKVFSYHRTLPYFADWTGVDIVASVEPKPGVPPPPSHLADLVGIAKTQGVKAILVESYYDQKTSKAVASHSDAAVVVIPGDVGAEDTRDYLGYVGTVLERVAAALK